MVASAPAPSITSVAPAATGELLALHDVAFVQAAYRVLLGREADDSGLAAFVAQVRQGDDKALVMARLALSEEGRQRRVKLAGLDELLRAHAPRSRAWPVRALHRLSRAFVRPANEPLERTLRVLDNRLYRIEVALDHQALELTRLRDTTAQVAITVDSIKLQHAGSPKVDAPSTSAAPTVLPRQVPPRLEQVMQGMRRAMTRRRTAP